MGLKCVIYSEKIVKLGSDASRWSYLTVETRFLQGVTWVPCRMLLGLGGASVLCSSVLGEGRGFAKDTWTLFSELRLEVSKKFLFFSLVREKGSLNDCVLVNLIERYG